MPSNSKEYARAYYLANKQKMTQQNIEATKSRRKERSREYWITKLNENPKKSISMKKMIDLNIQFNNEEKKFY